MTTLARRLRTQSCGWMLLLAVLAGGCALKSEPQNSSFLRIVLEDAPAPQFFSSLASSPYWILTGPSTTSDFDCFGVNVTGPGIAPSANFNNCTTTDNFGGSGPGVTSRLVPRGAAMELDVPAGPGRRIDVFGVYPKSQECGGSSPDPSDPFNYGYKIGSLTTDLVESRTVSIPIAFSSGQSYSVKCGTSSQTTTNIPISSGGATSTPTSWADPPTAPGGSPVGAAMSGADITEAGTENGTVVFSELYSGIASKMMEAEFFFDVSGYNLSEYQSIKVIWKGRAGYYGSTCSAPSSLTTPGGKIYVYQYGSTSWQTVGTITSGSTLEFLQGSFGSPSSFPNGSNKVIVRVTSASSGASSCSAVHTDLVKLQLIKN